MFIIIRPESTKKLADLPLNERPNTWPSCASSPSAMSFQVPSAMNSRDDAADALPRLCDGPSSRIRMRQRFLPQNVPLSASLPDYEYKRDRLHHGWLVFAHLRTPVQATRPRPGDAIPLSEAASISAEVSGLARPAGLCWFEPKEFAEPHDTLPPSPRGDVEVTEDALDTLPADLQEEFVKSVARATQERSDKAPRTPQ